MRVTALEHGHSAISKQQDSQQQTLTLIISSQKDLKDSIDELSETFKEGMTIMKDGMGAFRTAKRLGNAVNIFTRWIIKVGAIGGLMWAGVKGYIQ